MQAFACSHLVQCLRLAPKRQDELSSPQGGWQTDCGPTRTHPGASHSPRFAPSRCFFFPIFFAILSRQCKILEECIIIYQCTFIKLNQTKPGVCRHRGEMPRRRGAQGPPCSAGHCFPGLPLHVELAHEGRRSRNWEKEKNLKVVVGFLVDNQL